MHTVSGTFPAADTNCIELKNLGVVPPLVRLLSSPDKAVRSYSVICLASMAANGEPSRELVFSSLKWTRELSVCFYFSLTVTSLFLADVRLILLKADCISPLLALCTPDGEEVYYSPYTN